jgi:hypothetical protein
MSHPTPSPPAEDGRRRTAADSSDVACSPPFSRRPTGPAGSSSSMKRSRLVPDRTSQERKTCRIVPMRCVGAQTRRAGGKRRRCTPPPAEDTYLPARHPVHPPFSISAQLPSSALTSESRHLPGRWSYYFTEASRSRTLSIGYRGDDGLLQLSTGFETWLSSDVVLKVANFRNTRAVIPVRALLVSSGCGKRSDPPRSGRKIGGHWPATSTFASAHGLASGRTTGSFFHLPVVTSNCLRLQLHISQMLHRVISVVCRPIGGGRV